MLRRAGGWCGVAAAFLIGWAGGAGAAAAQDTAGTDAEAHALFIAGQVAYDEGRYDSALEDFRRAYDLSHRPELLFNVGAAAEHVRHDEEALAAYRQYLAERPEAANRSVVEARVAVLERAIAEHQPATPIDPTASEAPDATADATPPPAATSGGSDPAPFVVVGVGGAVLVVGAVLLGLGFAAIDQVQSARDAYWTDVQGAYQNGPVFTGIGFAALGVGAAAVIGGVVWALVGSGASSSASRAGRERSPRLSAFGAPGGLGVSLDGVF